MVPSGPSHLRTYHRDVTAASLVPELPFPLTSAHPQAWRVDQSAGCLVAVAPGHTDLYVNPGGAASADAESMLNAATLIGAAPIGDFQFHARVTVEFAAKYDAGVLLLWIDDRHWAKFCFEYSPDEAPMVVSVVTRELSDDANAFVVDGNSVWLRISRLDHAYAFHASTDGSRWSFVRTFAIGKDLADHMIGFEVQSPTGDGCTVTFDQIGFASTRLGDLRDGT